MVNTHLIRFNLSKIMLEMAETPAQYHEGDYIRTVEGLYFAVKGERHPKDRIIAYLRYLPDQEGDREQHGVKYRRVYSIEDTTKYLKQNHPQYLSKVEWLNQTLQTVPLSRIDKVFSPRTRLQEIIHKPETKLEKLLKKFVVKLCSDSGVTTQNYGVSGSQLIKLATAESDIDLNVYGREEGRKVYESLKRLRKKLNWVSPYNSITIQEVLKSRWGDTDQNLEKLSKIEINKVLQGKVKDIDYFIRLLLIESDTFTSIPRGRIKIKAKVIDASDSIYTPCTYLVDDVICLDPIKCSRITELKSYRGKFTEQAVEGDTVDLKGKLEEVNSPKGTFFRVILGDDGDHLIPIE